MTEWTLAYDTKIFIDQIWYQIVFIVRNVLNCEKSRFTEFLKNVSFLGGSVD